MEHARVLLRDQLLQGIGAQRIGDHRLDQRHRRLIAINRGRSRINDAADFRVAAGEQDVERADHIDHVGLDRALDRKRDARQRRDMKDAIDSREGARDQIEVADVGLDQLGGGD